MGHSKPATMQSEEHCMRLMLDFEVYSDVDIKSAPLDTYAGSPVAKIILCAYAFDEGPVAVYEPDSQPFPKDLAAALRDPAVTLVAWNVNFEKTVLRHKGVDIPIGRWLDPMVLARYAGLPGRLKDCAKVPMIGVPPEAATKSETALIKKFCCPNKNGVRTLPSEAPEDWALFVEYCRRDVLTMRHVLNWVEPRFPLPPRERKLWELDQAINRRGIPVDVGMARHGMSEANRIIAEAFIQMREITDVENPNSVMQLHPWLQDNGYPYDSLGKEFLEQALDELAVVDSDAAWGWRLRCAELPAGVADFKSPGLTSEGKRVVELRLSAAKASVKKFAVIVEQGAA